MQEIVIPNVYNCKTKSMVCRVSADIVERIRDLSEETGIPIRVLMDTILENGIKTIKVSR